MIVFLLLLALPALSQVRVWEGTMTLPTYQEGLPDVNPPFDLFATTRFNYPYTIRDKLTGEKIEQKWRALYLENEYLKCSVLPDIGGHLYSCTDKVNGAEMFYANPSIKKALIGYRGAWAAFGIEFNFPVSHNWVSMSPVDFAMVQNPDGSASVWVANTDRAYGMRWRVELRLRPASSLLEQAVRLYNPSPVRRRFYWWNNAGVEVWDDSKILYPMRHTASHGFTFVDTWPVNREGLDLSVVGNQTRGNVSQFVHASREPFMGVYHPRTRAGVAHWADWGELPGKKIWSWGADAGGREWRRVLSDNDSAYVEVQAGPFRNQETYAFLPPEETMEFREYWLPVRETGGFVRVTRDGALNMTRSGGAVEAALNVTRAVEGTARVGSATEQVRLTPRDTWRKRVECAAPCRFELRDASGAVLLAHTEGEFDMDPPEEVKTGPQPAVKFAGEVELGMDQELNGRLLEAYATYRRGLERAPGSFELNKAAGRLLVCLNRFREAIAPLTRAQRMVSNDPEIHYYLGLAWNAVGEARKARGEWLRAKAFQAFRAPALIQLAGLEGREGGRAAALRDLRAAGTLHAGMLEAALAPAARDRVAHWLAVDPANSMLRLAAGDARVWEHLAAEPDRVLEIVTAYMHLGLYAEAEALLAREYPRVDPATAEPGTALPQAHPLIAYYRGYCREKLGRSGKEDFAAASRLSTRYVFPQRAGTFDVLRRALEVQPGDATAHFLLGSLHAAGGNVDAALGEWEAARKLDRTIPVLHRNIGYTLMAAKGDAAAALNVFREGAGVDRSNLDIYSGMYRALLMEGRPPRERVEALRLYPGADLPPALAYRMAFALIEDGRPEEAARLFEGRFFPREEGGLDARQVRMEAQVLAGTAVEDVRNARLEFYRGEAEQRAGNAEAARRHWQRAMESGRTGHQLAFAYRAAERLGQAAALRGRVEAALESANAGTRGLLLAALGRKAEAALSLREALRAPDTIFNWHLAAMALLGK
ncbi:MAG: DUF5107 domain-containing protein [Bryobacteraceae bacterium]